MNCIGFHTKCTKLVHEFIVNSPTFNYYSIVRKQFFVLFLNIQEYTYQRMKLVVSAKSFSQVRLSIDPSTTSDEIIRRMFVMKSAKWRL